MFLIWRWICMVVGCILWLLIFFGVLFWFFLIFIVLILKLVLNFFRVVFLKMVFLLFFGCFLLFKRVYFIIVWVCLFLSIIIISFLILLSLRRCMVGEKGFCLSCLGISLILIWLGLCFLGVCGMSIWLRWWWGMVFWGWMLSLSSCGCICLSCLGRWGVGRWRGRSLSIRVCGSILRGLRGLSIRGGENENGVELYYKCVLGVFKCYVMGCILDMLNIMWVLNFVYVVVCNIYE